MEQEEQKTDLGVDRYSREVIVALEWPVEVHGEKHQSLTMRKSKVKDRMAVEKRFKDPVDKEINLYANLCDVPLDVIMELDETDYHRLQAAYSSFSPPSQP